VDISRRTFLAVGAAVGLGVSAWLAGCSAPPKGSVLADLQSRLDGQVLVPNDPDYRNPSEPSNGRYLSVTLILHIEDHKWLRRSTWVAQKMGYLTPLGSF
jgi:hypothetical protein